METGKRIFVRKKLNGNEKYYEKYEKIKVREG